MLDQGLNDLEGEDWRRRLRRKSVKKRVRGKKGQGRLRQGGSEVWEG